MLESIPTCPPDFYLEDGEKAQWCQKQIIHIFTLQLFWLAARMSICLNAGQDMDIININGALLP